MGQNHDFGNIEGRREEKHKLLRIWHRLVILMFLTFSWATIFFLFMNPEVENNPNRDVNLLDFIVVDFTNLEGSSMNLPLYYTVGAVVAFVVWVMYAGTSKEEYMDQIQERISRKKKITLKMKITLKVISFLDRVTYYIFYPVSYLTIPTDNTIASNKYKFFIRYGWLSHLEKTFLKRIIRKIDGYERVKKLDAFKDFPMLFSSEKTPEKAILSAEYRTFAGFFKGKKELEDIFMIAEGYLNSSGGKFDTQLERDEFNKLLSEKYGGNLDNFRVYDGRENIFLSFDLMKNLIDEETDRFMAFMREYSLSNSGLEYSRTFKESFSLFTQDKTAIKMVKGLHYPNPVKEGEKISKKQLIDRTQFLFSLYFRYCAVFYILNQYINLPAGTVVVRMDDYTLRMIIETYDNQNIVSIEERKNDGTGTLFRGDGLTNMFLLAWNYYNYSVSNSFKERVYKIFNLRDEEVTQNANEKEMMASDKAAAEYKSFMEAAQRPEEVNISEKRIEEAKNFILS